MQAVAVVESSMVDVALDYAQVLGLASFPVGPDCRTPWCAHGYKDASKDPVELRALFEPKPRANVAIATGVLSGVFVLDVDTKGADGAATLNHLQEEHGELPRTPLSATPSDGFHYWFKQPDRGLRNRVGFQPGLDVRTTGGSAAAPPSRKANGTYTWIVDPTDAPFADAPIWLLDLIDPPAPPRPPMQPIRVDALDRTARYVLAAIDAECGQLARLGPNSGRNLRLFQAAANLGELVAAGLLSQDVAEGALEAAAVECGLSRDDGAHSVRATIASGMRKGLANPRDVRGVRR